MKCPQVGSLFCSNLWLPLVLLDSCDSDQQFRPTLSLANDRTRGTIVQECTPSPAGQQRCCHFLRSAFWSADDTSSKNTKPTRASSDKMDEGPSHRKQHQTACFNALQPSQHRCSKSRAPTPSTDNTVANGYMSVIACNKWDMHSEGVGSI